MLKKIVLKVSFTTLVVLSLFFFRFLFLSFLAITASINVTFLSPALIKYPGSASDGEQG